MHVKSHERIQFKIDGMDCAEEVGILRREIGPMVGGEDRLAFDVLNGVMSVAGLAPEDQGRLIEAIGRTGMRARPIAPASISAARGATRNCIHGRAGRLVVQLKR